MSLYPPDDNTFDPMYPSKGKEVYDPMRSDLDGGGFNIYNLDSILMDGSGAITGVNTINGLVYPPPNPVHANNNWLYTTYTNQLIYSGYGAQQNSIQWENTVYSPAGGTAVVLQPYTWPSGTVNQTLFTVPYAGTYRITATIRGVLSQLGTMDLAIYVNGANTNGGNMVWAGYNSALDSITSTGITIVPNLAVGATIMIVGADADAAGYSINIGAAGASTNDRLSSWLIEYLG
jgi:hypothetical protein